MKITDLTGLATRNLVRRMGRTALTVIGVVVGSCAVVVMISLGIAQNKANEEMLAGWGDLKQIQVYNYGHSVGSDNKTPPDLNEKQLKVFEGWDHVEAVSPFYAPYFSGGTITAGHGDRYTTDAGSLMGVCMSAMPDMGYELVSGSWPDDTQSYGKDKLPVVVPMGAAYLFADSHRGQNSSKRMRYSGQVDEQGNPIPPFIDITKDKMTLTITNGKTDNLKTQSWELVVVGTMDFGTEGRKNSWSDYSIGMRVSDLVMVQAALAKLTGDSTLANSKYDNVIIKVDDVDSVDEVSTKLSDLGYSVGSMTSERDRMKQQVGRSQLMLGGLAAISLFVAALNIANTMTMAIYERTKEIGIMKVLGCEINDIRVEFLIESGAMGFIGGVIGGAISLVVGLVMNNITTIAGLVGLSVGGQSDEMYGYSAQATSTVISIIPPWLLLAALVFATVIGLLSGLGPANKAVRISALEAISHD